MGLNPKLISCLRKICVLLRFLCATVDTFEGADETVSGAGFDNMNLDDAQRSKVAGWIGEGLKLSEIQNRMMSEFNLKMTYMEVRLLVDDLKLTPKDAEPVKAPAVSEVAAATPAEPASAVGGGVSVNVDQIARPGALASGKVTFSDGQKAEWYLDQTGRLGLNPQQKGYRPPTGDIQEFQMALESELARMGM